jgi:4-hydroxy-tetrahydrodipicolinate synthase
MSQNWSGIFPIVLTPFKESGEIDEDSLRRQVEFCIKAGARGLVGPANASEFATLSDNERRQWLKIVIDAAGEQVPVIASITSGHELPAVELGRFAEDAGAGGVMAMPPHILHVDADGCYHYYQALAAALSIPICIQNFYGPLGTPMSAELIARMCRELDGVDYIKEESPPEPQQISATLEAAGDVCKGVLGGQGAIYIMDEYRRGSVGNMPGSHTTDVLVELWNRLDAGQEQGARELFNGLLPLMNYERLYGIAIYKDVLHRRGIISSPHMRAPGPQLDAYDREELAKILEGVEKLFII